MGVRYATAGQAQAVELSAEDRSTGQYGQEAIQKALEALHQDGFVVLKSVVNVSHVEKLNDYVCGEVDRRLAEEEIIFNHGVKSNLLQPTPLAKSELLFDDVYFNPFLIQVANAYLGTKPTWNFMTGNVALGNTGLRQPVHKDVAAPHPACPFFFIANFPLCDFNPGNGSTEFWLGSHAHTTIDDQVHVTLDSEEHAGGKCSRPICDIQLDILDKRRKTRPPIQPTCEKGDIMIRDLRTWHAGMPNSSERHRAMLALGYMSPNVPVLSHMSLKLPLSQRDFFTPEGRVADMLNVNADFVETTDEVKLREENNQFDLRPNASKLGDSSQGGIHYNKFVTEYKKKMAMVAK